MRRRGAKNRAGSEASGLREAQFTEMDVVFRLNTIYKVGGLGGGVSSVEPGRTLADYGKRSGALRNGVECCVVLNTIVMGGGVRGGGVRGIAPDPRPGG